MPGDKPKLDIDGEGGVTLEEARGIHEERAGVGEEAVSVAAARECVRDEAGMLHVLHHDLGDCYPEPEYDDFYLALDKLIAAVRAESAELREALVFAWRAYHELVESGRGTYGPSPAWETCQEHGVCDDLRAALAPQEKGNHEGEL